MGKVIPIEVKKTCCQLKAEGKDNREIYDEYYSGLAGFNQSDSGLNVVGFQIDESEITSSPEGTTIRVKRDNTNSSKRKKNKR